MFAFLFVAALGLGFIGLSGHLKQKHDVIRQSVSQIAENCADEVSCALAAPVLRDMYNSAEALRRQQISRDELPVVRIYMNDGALEKLSEKRASTLAKPRPIHISGTDDWVKATVLVQFADLQERSPVSLRLKGDWGDHFINPKKWSFRIKTRAGGYLFGMKALSIQHPVTRNFGYEPAILMHMRQNDILALRYRFVDVMINDFPIGIMAVEEHFGKEMLEAQNRRDGPILAVDEDPLWNQWDLNYNSPDTALAGDSVWNVNFAAYRDTPIKDYNGSDFERGTIATNNSIRGQALLRDFVDGRISSREAFDYEKLSRYWILTSVWRACHGVIWHNRRYYYNPISNLLEPIGFDNIPHPDATGPITACVDADIVASLQDPQFLEQVEISAADIIEQLESAEFSAALEDLQVRHAEFFQYEGFDGVGAVMPAETLADNVRSFLSDFRERKSEYGHFERSFAHSPAHFVGADLVSSDAELSMHLTSVYYPSADGGAIEFRNLTLDDIEVTRVYGEGKGGREDLLDVQAFSLIRGDEVPGVTSIALTVSDELLGQYSEFVADYTYRGKEYSRPVYIEYKDVWSGFSEDTFEALDKVSDAIVINPVDKHVTLSGENVFTQSIILPRDWQVIAEAGAVLEFRDGALLKLQGPLFVNGTEQSPVQMHVSSNLNYRDMGAWGGILVSKSHTRSRLNFLELRGTGTQNLANRQGFYGMTGCLSFFESDVDVVNSRFVDAQCEDALNIVRGDFVLDRIEIVRARADAFDADFSTGLIKDSVFADSGNDGIDISGTALELANINMTNIGDKAISVGENSYLNADIVRIDGANLGLVSKDLSVAFVNDVHFSNVSGTALMTYIKKQEYGPSSIECVDCQFLTEMTEIGLQDGTQIILNDQSFQRESLTFRQMVTAGLIEDDVATR